MSLLCCEELEGSGLELTPIVKNHERDFNDTAYDVPIAVRAFPDPAQISDSRILNNLLRDEDKYLPSITDFLKEVQNNSITPDMRSIVGEWIRDVVLDQNCSAEVYTLSMNLLDRFLSSINLSSPSQLQLLGSVCILVASKIRESNPVSGKTLITFTDHSITETELRDWELLVLHKLQWEVSSITSLDFLDHIMPKLPSLPGVDVEELRKYTETILVLAANEYSFSSNSPSLLASSSILLAAKCLSNQCSFNALERALSSLIKSDTTSINYCANEIRRILPDYLNPSSPDTSGDTPLVTSDPLDEAVVPNNTAPTPKGSPVPDLICSEFLDEELHRDDCSGKNSSDASSGFFSLPPRSNSPLSAVDIFTDVFGSKETSRNDFSILSC